MRDARQGEIWLVDMGLAGKVRPCLLLTDFPADDELALVTVLPHTTSLRGNRWECAIPKPFLKPGAFHMQQIQSVSITRLIRRPGPLDELEWELIKDRLADRFGLGPLNPGSVG
jgi:mRNA interferase MazF